MTYTVGQAALQLIPSFAGVSEAINTEAVKWGESAGEVFGDAFKARVDASLSNLADVRIGADTSEVDAKVAAIRAELETLTNDKVEFDFDDGEAAAQIALLHAQLIELGALSPDVKVDVSGGDRAVAEIAALDTAAVGLGDGLQNVATGGSDAEETIEGVGASAASSGPEISALTAALITLGVALVPIGGLVAGAFAALPALVAGAVSGIGALKLGLGGISGAISDFGKAQAPQASTGGGNGNAAAIQAISDAEEERNATESVTNATRELADARTNAATTISADEKSISDAVKSRNQAVAEADQQIISSSAALASARQQAADSIHSAEEQVASSENSVTEAIYTETQAQKSLVEARQAAADQLTSYSDQLADGALQQKANALAVTQAQQNLSTVQGNPSSTPLQIAQAQLALEQAQQAVKDQSDSYAELQRNAAAATAAGVDGSDQVIAAQHQVTDATQGVSDAQQSAADAANALSEAQVAGAQNIQNAEDALAAAWAADTTARVNGNDAIRAAEAKLASDRIKNAANIAGGEKAVTVALQDQADTLKRISLQSADGGGGSTAESPAAKYAADLAGLTPAGQAFVEYVTGTLEPMLSGLKSKTQEALLPGLLTGLKELQPLFTAIGGPNGPIIVAAKGIGDFATGLGKVLGSKSGTEELFGRTGIFAQGAGFMASLGGDVNILIGAFLGIGSQASPIVDHLESGIHSIVQDFANWVTDGGFQGFLTWLATNGPGLVTDMENFAKFVGAFVVWITPLGVLLDQVIGLLSTFLTDILSVYKPIYGLGPAITDALGGVPKWVKDNVIDPFVNFFEGLPGDVVSGLTKAGNFLDLVFVDVVKGLGVGGTWLIDHIQTPILNFFKGLPAEIASAASGMWNGLGDAFIDAINDIVSVWDGLRFPGINTHIPGIGTIGGFGLPHIDPIKHLASGGDIAGGLALVGEHGPELVNFQGAAHISDANITAALVGGNNGRSGPAVQVENFNAYDDADFDGFMRMASFAVSAKGL